MKKILLFMLMVLCIACGKEKKDRIKIGITQIVEHQSLDDVRQGIVDSLKANGYGAVSYTHLTLPTTSRV